MNRHTSFLATAAFAAFAFLSAAPAHAQATRTWVSGVGDDANPCSRTAPCKTFAGAISKTAANGEINCIDPGGFGGVTITKSMIIDCTGFEGGVLVSGSPGITVNAAAGDVVRLRGLDLVGVGTGTNGVRFFAGAALHIDDCRIKGFSVDNAAGVSFTPSTVAELFISNSLISENGNPANALAAGGGVIIQPTGTGTARAVLTNVSLVNNAQGLRADSTGASAANAIKVSVVDSVASGNAFAGFAAVSNTSAVEMMADGARALNNAGAGFTANGANAKIRMGRSVATGNGTGTLQAASGVIESYQTNQIIGNTSDGTRVNISQN